MTVDKTQAQKVAHWLNWQIALGRHWRDIAEGFPPIVKAGTLCRIAKSNGAWVPNKKIMDAIVPPTKRIADMSTKELTYCLENRKVMA
jgi:hypothetical protein